MGALVSVVGTVSHYCGRIALTALVAVMIYSGAKLARKCFKAYQELFVMWSVAFGRRWMPKVKSLRIQPYLCKTAELDDVSVEECFRFHCEAFKPATDMTMDKQLFVYRNVLLSYSHVLFCREKLDGSLRGVVLLGVEHKTSHTLLKIGLMLTQKNYRGGPWMRLAAACLIVRELVLHPRTPLYMLGKLSTYKPYIMSTVMPETFPRYDRDTPEEYKEIAEDFVSSIKVQGAEYDRETMVLRRRVGVVRQNMVTISERDMINPHIRFFNERNSGWREGDQLVTLAKVTWSSITRNLIRVALRQFSQSSSQSSNAPRGNSVSGNVNRKSAARVRARLTRGVTFQDMEAALHSLRYHAVEEETKKCERNGDAESERNGDVGSVRNGDARSRRVEKRISFIDRLYSNSDDEEFNIDL